MRTVRPSSVNVQVAPMSAEGSFRSAASLADGESDDEALGMMQSLSQVRPSIRF